MDQYYLTNFSGIIKLVNAEGQVFFIPADPNNADFRLYLEWLAQGNEPLPPN